MAFAVVRILRFMDEHGLHLTANTLAVVVADAAPQRVLVVGFADDLQRLATPERRLLLQCGWPPSSVSCTRSSQYAV